MTSGCRKGQSIHHYQPNPEQRQWLDQAPLDEKLRAKAQNQKLRTIPVRMIFNDPKLNLRTEYNLFDHQIRRFICVGNGETCQ